MGNQSEDGSSSPSVHLTVDLDQPAVGAAVLGLSPLQKLLAATPAAVQPAISWLPDLSLTEAAVAFNLASGATGTYVVVSDPPGTELASVFLYLLPGPDSMETAVGLTLSAAIDLGGTPLFGALLRGVSITDFALNYASQDFIEGTIVLPQGAPSPFPAVSSGLSLGFTVTSDGSAQLFEIPTPTASDATDSARRARRVTHELAPDGPEDPVRASTDAGLVTPLLAQTAGAPSVSWITVQKTLGPLTVDRVGIVTGDGSLGLALDAEVNTDVVSIQLTGFVITFTPGEMAGDPVAISLDGLAVAVAAPPVQIGGSLVRSQTPSGSVEYDGSLLITIGAYAVNAVGSYTLIDGAPSLFVFGIVRGQFGGPPWFFVTGLAAGFAVNRALRLPTIQQLATFPLIQAALGTAGADDALTQLNAGGWVPPTLHEYWVAAGVCFTTFELLNGFALLTVQFGNQLTIALLGAAALQLPTAADGSFAFAYAEITLEVLIQPAAGVLSIEALLTPNSYVIDPSCQLTGGLACDVWFGRNPHAGDFAITLGGWHPRFVKPAWYPSVPRLGFSWHMSDALQVTGESYFGLTPSCVMAGGLLSVKFAAGPLRAWFIAQADFIIYWRPFSFDVDVSVSIGVSFSMQIFFASVTLTLELGVSLELWGPPIAGIAHVHLWVVSFDIDINGGGSSSPAAQTLDSWSTFATSSLPPATSICRSRAGAGLQTIVDNGSEAIWVFGGDLISLTTETAVPATTVTVTGAGSAVTLAPPSPATSYPPVNAFPMGNVDVTSSHQILIGPWTGADWQPGEQLPDGVDTSGWGWTTVAGTLPGALWGPRGTGAQPSLGTQTVDAVVGASGTGEATISQGLQVDVAALLIDELPARALALVQEPTGGPGPLVTGDSRPQIVATINTQVVATARAGAAAAAESAGLASNLTGGELPLLVADIDAVLVDPPMLGAPGSTGPPAPASGPALVPSPIPDTADTPPDKRPAAFGPSPRALFRRDQSSPASDDISASTRRRSHSTAIVSDRWSSSREARLVDAWRPTGSSDDEAPSDVPMASGRLWSGETMVWDLPYGHPSTLHTDGQVALWLVAIDGAQHILRHEVVAPEPSTHRAPTPSRFAITAVDDDDHETGVVGWHAATSLRQIASQTLLGDRLLIRPQSPVGAQFRRSMRHARHNREFGITTGAQLLQKNWTQGPAGLVRPGWIETHLPAWCEAISLRLVRDGSRATRVAPPDLTIQLRPPGDSKAMVSVTPTDTDFHGRANDGIWRFTLTRNQQPSGPLVVRSTAPDGWQMDGLFGFSSHDTEWRSWPPTTPQTTPASPDLRRHARVWWQ